MSAPMTRGQLKTRALQRADFPINPNSAYIDQSPGGELEQIVDTKLARLYTLLVETDQLYNLSSATYISTVANQADYQLPQDFMSLDSIYYVVQRTNGVNEEVPLRRFMRHQQGQRGAYFNWGPPPIMYSLMGKRLRFEPVPTQALTNIIKFYYVPTYKPPATDTLVINDFVRPGWEDYIVNGVAADLRIKEGLGEEGPLLALTADYEHKIQQEADERDRFAPNRVQYTGWQESDGEWSGAGDQYFGYYGTW